MGKLKLDDLRTLRERKKQELGFAGAESPLTYIFVGMGTSGIAAGAKLTYATLQSELEYHGLKDVVLKQTGSLGLDHAEPTVEVRLPGMPPVIYGNVDAAVASKIVRRHIVERSLVNAHVFDRPAGDIGQSPQRPSPEAR